MSAASQISRANTILRRARDLPPGQFFILDAEVPLVVVALRSLVAKLETADPPCTCAVSCTNAKHEVEENQ